MGIFISRKFTPHIVDNKFERIRNRGIYIYDCNREINIISQQPGPGNHIFNCPEIVCGIEVIGNPNARNTTIKNNYLELNNNAIGIYDVEFKCSDRNAIIEGNQIYDVKYGILIENDGLPKVLGNDIVFFNQPANGAIGYGVYCRNNCSPVIESNNLTTTTSPDRLYGITAEQCQIPYICNNYIRELERGIVCRGTMMGTKVKLNRMDKDLYGFVLENGGDIGEQGNAATNDVSDNQWISSGVYDTYSIGFSNLSNSTVFDVRNVNNFLITSPWNDPFSILVDDFIILNPNDANCAIHDGWRIGGNAESAIVATTDDTLQTEEEKWIARKQLYGTVTDESFIDTTNSSIIEDFIISMELQPIGDFSKVDKEINEAFSDTNLINADVAKLDSARVKNQQVEDTKVIEFYKKIVNDIYLSTIARGNDNYTDDQRNWLNEIAPLCPFEAGPAVYQARMLLGVVDYETIYNDDDCDNSAQLRILNKGNIPKVEKAYFNLYPNPANDVIILDYIMPVNITGELVIMDISGKEIEKYGLNQNSSNIRVSCNKLSQGIYLYKIFANGIAEKSGKVSIIR